MGPGEKLEEERGEGGRGGERRESGEGGEQAGKREEEGRTPDPLKSLGSAASK